MAVHDVAGWLGCIHGASPRASCVHVPTVQRCSHADALLTSVACSRDQGEGDSMLTWQVCCRMFPAPVNPDTVRHCLITFSTILTPVAFIEQAGGRASSIATCATARYRFTGKCWAARLQADESTRRVAGVSLAPPRSSVGDIKYECMAGGRVGKDGTGFASALSCTH